MKKIVEILKTIGIGFAALICISLIIMCAVVLTVLTSGWFMVVSLIIVVSWILGELYKYVPNLVEKKEEEND